MPWRCNANHRWLSSQTLDYLWALCRLCLQIISNLVLQSQASIQILWHWCSQRAAIASTRWLYQHSWPLARKSLKLFKCRLIRKRTNFWMIEYTTAWTTCVSIAKSLSKMKNCFQWCFKVHRESKRRDSTQRWILAKWWLACTPTKKSRTGETRLDGITYPITTKSSHVGATSKLRALLLILIAPLC